MTTVIIINKTVIVNSSNLCTDEEDKLSYFIGSRLRHKGFILNKISRRK